MGRLENRITKLVAQKGRALDSADQLGEIGVPTDLCGDVSRASRLARRIKRLSIVSRFLPQGKANSVASNSPLLH